MLRNGRLMGALLLCCAARAATTAPARALALDQTRYEMRQGEPVAVAASADTLDFLLKATSRKVEIQGAATGGLVVGPNRTRDQLLLAAPARTKPGEYTATISATSATGEQRATTLSIVVHPRQAVPSGASRPPVVLLNGWEEGFTGTCTVSTSSSETFGNLAQYLVSDGVPIVYLFDNCLEDPDATIETLGVDLATFLSTIQYADGTQVPQIDLVAFSLGGLIARAYLAGLQPDETFAPPSPTLVRDLILIATPNFGSYVTYNYLYSIPAGTQSAELIPASSFLWNLATWNQRGDDLRGVNALAIVGNAGPYLASLSATTQINNASDGLVTLTSAALGFALPDSTPTQVVPYCHVDPSTFTNTTLGTFNCNAVGIANVTDDTQETGVIVRSFLAGTDDWKSIGGAAADDPYLSVDGGIYFAMQSQADSYVTDLTQVEWGSVLLATGGDTDTVYYTDFASGTGDYQATSSSLGTYNCSSLAEAVGYFSAARCKIDTAIFSVGPLASVPGRIVNSGTTITITGTDFGSQCSSCQVLAIPAGSATQTALAVSNWTNTSISAMLPASMTGLLTIQVNAVPGTDAITIMAAQPGPSLAATPTSLTFAYTGGGAVPAAQSIQVTNSGTGTLTWTAAASNSWLSVSPASGTAPSTLSVSVSPSGLSAGSYSGAVTITATGASGSPISVAVTLTVSAAAVTLVAAPQALTFNYTVGGSAPATQNISITNGGSGTLAWTASSSVFWAGLSAASGSAPATLTVSVNPSNIAAGTYTGNVQITASGASGSPATVALTLAVAGTQPAGTIASVSNAGSFLPGFASAGWVSIFGTNLSASTQVWQASDFVNGLLPTTLQGVSVTIDGLPAYVEYISPTQINVLAPDDAATGAVQVQVTTAGQPSNSVAAPKQQYAPAWFTFANGQYVAAQHANYSDIGKVGLIAGVTTTPAQPGEVILMYGTGFGPTDPAAPTAQLVTAPAPLPANAVQIAIGGLPATIQFAGITESGLYQFNVTVPSLPDGDAAVVATIGGVSTQSGISLTIQQ